MADTDFICPFPLVTTEGTADTTLWAYEPGNCAVPCPTIAYTEDEWNGNVILVRTINFVSLILCFLVFVNHVCEFSPRKYVSIMFIGGFLFSSTILSIFFFENRHSDIVCNTDAHYVKRAPLCVFQAAAYIFAITWIIIWSCIFAWDVYSQIRLNPSSSLLSDRSVFNTRSTLIAFAVSSLVTILPLSAGNLGFDPKASIPICLYLFSDDSSYFWLTFFLPLVIVVIACNMIGFATVVQVQRMYVSTTLLKSGDEAVHTLYDEDADRGGGGDAAGQWRGDYGHSQGPTYGRSLLYHDEGSQSHHSAHRASLVDAQPATRESLHSYTSSAHSHLPTHTPENLALSSYHSMNSLPMSIPYSHTPKHTPYRGGMSPKRIKTTPQLSSSYLLEAEVPDLEWSNSNQNLQSLGEVYRKGHGTGTPSPMSSRLATAEEPSQNRARSRTEVKDEVEDSPYRAQPSRFPLDSLGQDPSLASSYQPTNSLWGYDLTPPASPSGSSHDGHKLGSAWGAEYERTHRGSDRGQSHRLDLASRCTSVSSSSQGASVVSVSLLNDPLIHGKHNNHRKPRDKSQKLWISWVLSRYLGMQSTKGRRERYQPPQTGDETDEEEDGSESSTSSEGLLTMAANALYTTWRYNGRSIVFVCSFCLITFCIIPLLIQLYWVDYNHEVNTITDYARCLVTASMLCDERTQVGVNACAEVACGGHAPRRNWLQLITVVLIFISGFGIIPSIIFGIAGDLTPNTPNIEVEPGYVPISAGGRKAAGGGEGGRASNITNNAL